MSEPAVVEVGEGVRVAYRTTGVADGPPVVFLHGTGSEAASWDRVAAAIGDSFRSYALDLRGYGRTESPPEYSFELMCEDVVGFLDALGLDAVTLVGHSMGGTVAFLLTEEHPDRVSRLVIEDSTPPYRPDGPIEIPADADEDPRYNIIRQLNDPDPAWWDRISKITVPTLIIAGGPDSHVPQDRIAAVAQRIPDCRVLTIPVGHRVHTTAPDDFIAALRPFLPS
jgi:3-oxoadipate enol-lactonase